jgi:hypothetical protein
MRYWAYLAGKVVVAAVPLYGLFRLIELAYPAIPKKQDDYDSLVAPLAHGAQYLLCDLWLLAWFVVCVGTMYMVVWDQRRRCRVCLRQLRMPIETGSRSYMLQLGRPTVESICPYGHGTLKEDELQITGHDAPEWKRNSDDIWDELCAPQKDNSQEP